MGMKTRLRVINDVKVYVNDLELTRSSLCSLFLWSDSNFMDNRRKGEALPEVLTELLLLTSLWVVLTLI